MAQKRMFDKTITNDDNFLEMPMSSQVLYFHLSMNADDDGFLNNWKSIMRMTSAKEDDLKVLIAKQYIIPFDSGVIVIKHWRINNFLRKDRHIGTKFKEELSMLKINDNQEYTWLTNGQPRIDKNRIEKKSIDKSKEESKEEKKTQFKKPTLEEVKEYCLERKNNVDPKKFIDFYEVNNWTDSKGNKVKSWKQKVITWEAHQPKQKEVPEWFNKNYEIDNTSTEEMENILKELEQ